MNTHEPYLEAVIEPSLEQEVGSLFEQGHNTAPPTVNITSDNHRENAEFFALSVMLQSSESRALAISTLTAAHFIDLRSRLLFSAMKEYDQKSDVDEFDFISLLNFAWKTYQDGASLELNYLSFLSRLPCAVENAEYYIQQLLNIGIDDALESAAQDIQEITSDLSLNSQEKIAQAEGLIDSISSGSAFSGPVLVSEALGEFVDLIDDRSENDGMITGLSTGLKDMDELLGGLQATDLVIVAGRPSQGKTSLAENMYTQSVADGKNAVFFSLEMGRVQILERMFASWTGVNLSRVRTGELDDLEWTKLTQFVSSVQEWSAYIDDAPSLTVDEIRAQSKLLHKKNKLDLIVIDYLQLITGGEGESQALRIGDISRKLKALAKELDVPVVLLSQLSRSVEQRPDKRPILSDLRDSGAIEQDADVIIFVYRDEYYNQDSTAKGIAELLVRKHRNGATGDIFTQFKGAHCRFKDLEDYSSSYDNQS